MSSLLQLGPFSARDDVTLLREMNEICEWHMKGCADYRSLVRTFTAANALSDLPFLHVGVFKLKEWRTSGEGLKHLRKLKSSATSGRSSVIALDARSSALQAESGIRILREFLGEEPRSLIILDSASALLVRNEISARMTAALSLRPLSSEVHFSLKVSNNPESMDWEKVEEICRRSGRILIYGFSWILWSSWATAAIPQSLRNQLKRTQVNFVHSGGWKSLEALRVSRGVFDQTLLATVGPGSSVLDFYGLVEQVGILFPLCKLGFRHAPAWARVIVRDPWTLKSLKIEEGVLQLMNPLAYGAPYHSVLTEDVGRLVDGNCPCGLSGQRFELLGRIPKSELRGCSNV